MVKRPPVRYPLRSEAMKGEKNHNWKGNKACAASGHCRAIRKFPKQPCEICGNPKTERHHIDDNTLNNSPENIRQLCRYHHMEVDGRLEGIKHRNILGKKEVDLDKFMILYNMNLTEEKMASNLGVSSKVVRNRKRELGLKYNGPYRNRSQFVGGK